MIRSTHVLARLKSDIPLKRTSATLPDGSYRAELSGDGVTVKVRVIEYWVEVEGQEVPEMFCLVTDLMDWEDYPAPELARLYKWRWDGSETALREAKAPLHGAGPRHRGDAPLRAPCLIAQEIAAWAVSTGMTRGVTLCAARAAVPARKGRRAGQPVRSRDLSLTRARPPHPRRDPPRGRPVQGADQGNRAVPERLRPGPAPCPQVQVPGTSFPHAGPAGTVTRIAPAVITLANTPA